MRSGFRTNCATKQKAAKAALALLLVVMGGCERPRDEFGNWIGPVHASERLSRQGLAGVRPGMALGQAAALLAAQGYSPMARGEEAAEDETGAIRRRYFWIAAEKNSDGFRFPQTVRLSYAVHKGGTTEVVAIGHFQRITAAERRDVEAGRRSVLARFGRPSLWRQDSYRGELWDEMDYVAAPELRVRDRLEQLRACHADWQCEKVARKFDCRDTMRAGRSTGLRISFGQEGNRIYYELSDYRRMHDAELRAGKLPVLSLRGAFCAVQSFDGVRTMVAHPE